jgi:peroxiredoxin
VEAVAVPLLPLRDPSEVPNICISMDSPFLQPRYLEQEIMLPSASLHLCVWRQTGIASMELQTIEEVPPHLVTTMELVEQP